MMFYYVLCTQSSCSLSNFCKQSPNYDVYKVSLQLFAVVVCSLVVVLFCTIIMPSKSISNVKYILYLVPLDTLTFCT